MRGAERSSRFFKKISITNRRRSENDEWSPRGSEDTIKERRKKKKKGPLVLKRAHASTEERGTPGVSWGKLTPQLSKAEKTPS